jgi:hypothetical protein
MSCGLLKIDQTITSTKFLIKLTGLGVFIWNWRCVYRSVEVKMEDLPQEFGKKKRNRFFLCNSSLPLLLLLLTLSRDDQILRNTNNSSRGRGGYGGGGRGRGRGNGRSNWSGNREGQSFYKPSMVQDPWQPITNYLIMNGFLPPPKEHQSLQPQGARLEESSQISEVRVGGGYNGEAEQQQQASGGVRHLVDPNELSIDGPAVDPNELSIDD